MSRSELLIGRDATKTELVSVYNAAFVFIAVGVAFAYNEYKQNQRDLAAWVQFKAEYACRVTETAWRAPDDKSSVRVSYLCNDGVIYRRWE